MNLLVVIEDNLSTKNLARLYVKIQNGSNGRDNSLM